MSMLAHVHMHVRGIEVIIGELMVPTFYFTSEKKNFGVNFVIL